MSHVQENGMRFFFLLCIHYLTLLMNEFEIPGLHYTNRNGITKRGVNHQDGVTQMI